MSCLVGPFLVSSYVRTGLFFFFFSLCFLSPCYILFFLSLSVFLILFFFGHRRTYCYAGMLQGRLTPSSSSVSRRWRGITVTSSISHIKATSEGISPGLRGRAIVMSDHTPRCIALVLFICSNTVEITSDISVVTVIEGCRVCDAGHNTDQFRRLAVLMSSHLNNLFDGIQ